MCGWGRDGEMKPCKWVARVHGSMHTESRVPSWARTLGGLRKTGIPSLSYRSLPALARVSDHVLCCMHFNSEPENLLEKGPLGCYLFAGQQEDHQGGQEDRCLPYAQVRSQGLSARPALMLGQLHQCFTTEHPET
eukprot:738992-Pelagomonas_calceolata.AAC.3